MFNPVEELLVLVLRINIPRILQENKGKTVLYANIMAQQNDFKKTQKTDMQLINKLRAIVKPIITKIKDNIDYLVKVRLG